MKNVTFVEQDSLNALASTSDQTTDGRHAADLAVQQRRRVRAQVPHGRRAGVRADGRHGPGADGPAGRPAASAQAAAGLVRGPLRRPQAGRRRGAPAGHLPARDVVRLRESGLPVRTRPA